MYPGHCHRLKPSNLHDSDDQKTQLCLPVSLSDAQILFLYLKVSFLWLLPSPNALHRLHLLLLQHQVDHKNQYVGHRIDQANQESTVWVPYIVDSRQVGVEPLILLQRAAFPPREHLHQKRQLKLLVDAILGLFLWLWEFVLVLENLIELIELTWCFNLFHRSLCWL